MARKPKAKPQPIDYTLKDYEPSSLPHVKVSYAAVLTRPLYYPENQFAKGLAFLMRRMAFTKMEVDHLRNMGFSVEVCIREIEIPEECK